jgi:8-oxo-dGTP pyrophosphatase MutT (NUDIX family)
LTNWTTILYRQVDKPQPNTWGTPTGKLDPGETPLDGVRREITEETGLNIPADLISFYATFYVVYPDLKFVYHLFHSEVNEKAAIKISPREHQATIWITPLEALRRHRDQSLILIDDFDYCLKLFYKIAA